MFHPSKLSFKTPNKNQDPKQLIPSHAPLTHSIIAIPGSRRSGHIRLGGLVEETPCGRADGPGGKGRGAEDAQRGLPARGHGGEGEGAGTQGLVGTAQGRVMGWFGDVGGWSSDSGDVFCDVFFFWCEF